LVDLYGCEAEVLNDPARLQASLRELAKDLGCTIIKELFHSFAPCGVSGVIVIAESHLAIHTWPEHGFAAVDLFTCNSSTELHTLATRLSKELGAKSCDFEEKARGRLPALPPLVTRARPALSDQSERSPSPTGRKIEP